MKAKIVGGYHHGTELQVQEGLYSIRLHRPMGLSVVSGGWYPPPVPENLDVDVYRLVKIYHIANAPCFTPLHAIFCPSTWSDERLFDWLLANQ